MRERKQSFLERLSGTRSVEGDTPADMHATEEKVLSEKPWSPRIDGMNDSRTYTETDKSGLTKLDGANREIEDEAEDEEAGLAVDVFEADNELIIQSMIAGVTPDNLHITVTRDAVTIRGKRIPPQGVPEEQYVGRELYWGEFSREIPLPFEVNTDGAEAVEKYGLLIIRLPRLDTTRAQELKVKAI